MLKLVFSVLNLNHQSQNIGLIKYYILWKYTWKILNGCLLQWCYFFVHMLRYFAGLRVFCFPKTNPNIERFRIFLSFCLGIDYDEFTNCKRMQHVQSCLFSNETFCFYTLTRLHIIQIAVENQCKKKARGNSPRIANLPFQHSHNSLRVYCAS